MSSINFSYSNFYKINVTTSYKMVHKYLHRNKNKKKSHSFKDFFKLSHAMDKKTIFFCAIPICIDSKQKFWINGYLLVLNNLAYRVHVLSKLFTNLQIQKDITGNMYNKHLGISIYVNICTCRLVLSFFLHKYKKSKHASSFHHNKEHAIIVKHI